MSKRAIAAIILLIIAAIFTLTVVTRRGWYLTVRNGDTKAVYTRMKVAEGDEFSIGFIHSVNKSPLIDVYQIKDHRIYVVRTIYYGFGAGVQTEIEDGQTLTYGDNGEMIVSGFNQEMTHLSYIVGTVSDHVLTIHNKEISLRDLCGRNSTVEFTCEFQPF